MLWIEMLWIEKLRIEKASETDVPLQPRQYLVFDEMPDLLHIYIPVVFINIIDIFRIIKQERYLMIYWDFVHYVIIMKKY